MVKEIEKIIRRIINKILNYLIKIELFFHKKSRVCQKKLLLIRIDGVGDFILFSPMFKYYQKKFPCHSLVLLVNEINKDLAARAVGKDCKILLFNRKKFGNNFFYRRKLILSLARENFDIAAYPAYSREPFGDYLIKTISCRIKIGFDGDLCNITKLQKKINDGYYSKLIKADCGAKIESERNKEFIEKLGIKVGGFLPKFKPNSEDFTAARQVLLGKNLSDEKYAVIFPGSGGNRVWPAYKFAEVADWLKYNRCEPVICGTEQDKEIAAQIKKCAKNPLIDIVGLTTLPVLAAVIKQSVLYFGNDTGPAHLASAVGTPAVCIIGGGHLGRFFPYGDLNKNRVVFKRMPCYNCDWRCKYKSYKCINDIEVEQAIAEIKKIRL